MAGTIRILTVGRPSRSPLRAWIDDIVARCGRYARVEIERIPASRARRAHERIGAEGTALLEKIGRAPVAVTLDSAGELSSSQRFASRLESWRRGGAPLFVIGSADGLATIVKERATHSLSLGEMTLAHELALAVLVEQLYRALSSAAGHPYGRH